MIKGYKISANYTQVKIWEFNDDHQLVGTFTCIPFKVLTRYGKYVVIADRLRKERIKCPVYKPTSKEIAASARTRPVQQPSQKV